MFRLGLSIDTKSLSRGIPLCTDKSPAWYQFFATHCSDLGLYVHPLYCFQPAHGGNRGFSFGDAVDDDLPKHFGMKIATMESPLWSLLNKSDMFPSDSDLPSLVKQHYGDGYGALKSILASGPHPVFEDQPSVMSFLAGGTGDGEDDDDEPSSLSSERSPSSEEEPASSASASASASYPSGEPCDIALLCFCLTSCFRNNGMPWKPVKHTESKHPTKEVQSTYC